MLNRIRGPRLLYYDLSFCIINKRSGDKRFILYFSQAFPSGNIIFPGEINLHIFLKPACNKCKIFILTKSSRQLTLFTVYFVLGASSSILEDKHKVLEKILDDLHHGNFHPVVRPEVTTPDTDIEALEFSNISFIGSPVRQRPVSEVMDEDFLTPTLKHVNIRTSSGQSHLLGLMNHKTAKDLL